MDLDEELRKAVYERNGWYSEKTELDFNGLTLPQVKSRAA